MQKYRNLKLKTKLVISFLILAFMSVVIGAIGMVGLTMIREADLEMYQENTLPMDSLAEISDNLTSQRVCAANMVIFHTQDPAFSAEEAAELTEKEAQFEEGLAAYSQSVNTPEEQALYDSINSLYFSQFEALKTELRAAVDAGEVTAMSQAVRKIDEVGHEILSYVDQSFALNVNMASEKVASNESLAATTGIVQAGATLVGIGMAIVFAFFLSNVITQPINRIMTVTKQVGETGSLDLPDELMAKVRDDATATDETGQTAHAFVSMMDSLILKARRWNRWPRGI